ncbi:MAG: heme ABC transporter permease [Azospirillaceae bacterium]
MHKFANPARFNRLAARLMPWLVGVAGVALPVGLYLALVASPPDYQQGEAVRIMYVHVPSAWLAMFGYALMALASVAFLVWRHPLAGLFTKAVAPVGAVFTFLCLVTGGLWGEPMWGTWWVWDARLTSVLILFFLYLGYLALAGAFDDPQRGLRSGAVLVLVGTVNLPIIKFSVDWWNTLHQPASISRIGTPAVDAAMLWPLLVMMLGLTALFLAIALVRTRTEIARRKIEVLRLATVGRQVRRQADEAVEQTA